MTTTSSPSETTSTPWYVDGAPIFANDGEYVGGMNVPSIQGGALVIVQGWPFTQARYLPLQFVRRQDASGVYLTLSKAQVRAAAVEDAAQGGITRPGLQPTAGCLPLDAIPFKQA
jgi:hypothetical protein